MVITSLSSAREILLILLDCISETREISLPLCPETGCYQPSCFKSTGFSVQYLHLNQAENVFLIILLKIVWKTQTWGFNHSTSESPWHYGTLLTQKQLQAVDCSEPPWKPREREGELNECGSMYSNKGFLCVYLYFLTEWKVPYILQNWNRLGKSS